MTYRAAWFQANFQLLNSNQSNKIYPKRPPDAAFVPMPNCANNLTGDLYPVIILEN